MNSEESISTLKFADRAKQVMVQAMVNESRPVDYELVKKLQQEIASLKGLIKRLVQSQSKEAVKNGRLPSADIIHQVFAAGDGQLLTNGHLELSHVPEDAATAFPRVDLVDPPTIIAAAVDNGSTLEYVMSLENTLKRARLDSHQLIERNEVLMKEIECLKLHNMQLQQISKSTSQARSVNSGDSIRVIRDEGNHLSRSNVGSSDDRDPIDESADARSVLDKARRRQVIQSLHALLAENQTLQQIADDVQQVIKKFFKFQIEEEQMRERVDASFRALKGTCSLCSIPGAPAHSSCASFTSTAIQSSSVQESAHGAIAVLESEASSDLAPSHRKILAGSYPTKRDATLSKHQNQTISYISHDLEPMSAVRWAASSVCNIMLSNHNYVPSDRCLRSGRLPPMDDSASRILSSYSPPSNLSGQRDGSRNKSLPALPVAAGLLSHHPPLSR